MTIATGIEGNGARRNKTVGQLIEESLDYYGIKTTEDTRDNASPAF